MAIMRRTIRIYRRHDLDLYYLGLSKKYHLGAEIKKALIAYANDLGYTPPELPQTVDCSVVKTSMLLILYFDLTKPEEKVAFNFLKNIKYGYACSFLKTLYRSYLPITPLNPFYTDNGLQMTNAEVVRDIQRKQSSAIKKNILNSANSTDITDFADETNKTEINELNIQPSKINMAEEKNIKPEEINNNLNNLFMQMDALAH